MVIIHNLLPQRLLEISRNLKLEPFDFLSAKPPSGRVLRTCLMYIVWAASSLKSVRASAATKALRVLCTIYATQSWIGGDASDENCFNPWNLCKV
jgi:hypothetical protein